MIGETLFITIITLILSFILVAVTMNFFNVILNTNFVIHELFRPKIIMYIVLIGILTGIASGVYPAFFLSEFNPATILKGAFLTGRKGTRGRRILVIGQIVLSVILITGTLVIYRQIYYMKNHPLGFDKEQKLIITLPDVDLMTNNYETIKSELKKHSAVLGVSASSSVPGRETFFWRLWPTGMRDRKSQPLNFINVDYDFIDMYDMEIIAGRSFDRVFGSDLQARGWVINEAVVKAYDWNSPVEATGKEMMDDRTPIIGVVKDFHFKGLQNEIEPLAFSVWSEHFNCFTLQVDLNNLGETISYANAVIQKFFPGVIFDYFFLDDDFDRQYRFEEQIGVLFSVFTSLGILIAVLGLFGLTAFIAEQRTKEIGIRKVFGASVYGLVLDFLKDFGKWVVIANIIAWPIAYFAMNKWLQNFAYRTKLNLWIFILSGFAALTITLLTVSYQSIKAARANPVDSLRYE
jgi:putative ABC transport system permease protein